MWRRLLLISGFFPLLVFLATLPLPRVDGHIVGSDGRYYYAILQSSVSDHDMDLQNDYKLLGVEDHRLSPIGRAACPFAVGSAILWLPFFMVARVVSTMGGGGGVPLSEALICVGTTIYAGIGLLLTYRSALRRGADQNAASLAALLLWWATSLIEYTAMEPSLSHGLSFFCNALFLWVWSSPASRSPSKRQAALLGATAALTALVRWQDGVVLLLPLVEILIHAFHAKRLRVDDISRAAILLAMFVVGFAPQFIMWRSIYGQYLTIPQGPGFLHWGAPKLAEVLFSGRHGLITWHPIWLLMLAGLASIWRRDRAFALATSALFLSQLMVNAMADDWWGGDGFGGRRFIGLLPWFVVPLSSLLASALGYSQRRRLVTLALAVTLVGWNGLSLIQYRLGFVPRDQALSLKQLTIDRIELPIQLAKRLLHR